MSAKRAISNMLFYRDFIILLILTLRFPNKQDYGIIQSLFKGFLIWWSSLMT